MTNETKSKNIHSSLMDKINETFIKLQNSNLNDLNDSTIVELHMHLNTYFKQFNKLANTFS